MTQSRRRVLASRPIGMCDADTVRTELVPVPEPAEGEALVRLRWLSIDPTIRTWMDDRPGYLPPIGLGEVIRSGVIGEIVDSRNDAYPVGSTVFGMFGWQDHALIGGAHGDAQIVPEGVDPTAALSVFGSTGMTAYFGLLDVGQPHEGDTVVVSGAAGATGSIVGQIAKIKGASNVVGIAGTAEKCAWLVDELGFDAAINYRTENVDERLAARCPDGIDVMFDNVGGAILDAALNHLALRARVVCCGSIARYNGQDDVPGLKNTFNLTLNRARMEGFLVLDYLDRFLEAQVDLFTWVAEGKITHQVHVVEGLEESTNALNLLFTGGNSGKVVVKIDA